MEKFNLLKLLFYNNETKKFSLTKAGMFLINFGALIFLIASMFADYKGHSFSAGTMDFAKVFFGIGGPGSIAGYVVNGINLRKILPPTSTTIVNVDADGKSDGNNNNNIEVRP